MDISVKQEDLTIRFTSIIIKKSEELIKKVLFEKIRDFKRIPDNYIMTTEEFEKVVDILCFKKINAFKFINENENYKRYIRSNYLSKVKENLDILEIEFYDHLLLNNYFFSDLYTLKEIDKSPLRSIMNTKFVNNYHSKFQDDDSLDVSYLTSIGNVKFSKNIYNYKGYCSLYNKHTFYKKNKEEYEKQIPDVQNEIFESIRVYKIIDKSLLNLRNFFQKFTFMMHSSPQYYQVDILNIYNEIENELKNIDLKFNIYIVNDDISNIKFYELNTYQQKILKSEYIDIFEI